MFNKKLRNIEENKTGEGHAWQNAYRKFFAIAIILHGEVPEAEEWISYYYGTFQVRIPEIGREDGGWANGVGYFSLSAKLESILLMNRFTGHDFFHHPWYENVSRYLFYTAPVGHPAVMFSDGKYMGKSMLLNNLLWRAREDPLAESYMAMFEKHTGEEAEHPLFGMRSAHVGWFLLPSGMKRPETKSFSNLPKAYAFRDVGDVAMHSDLEEPDRNLMIAFRSSPYGGN